MSHLRFHDFAVPIRRLSQSRTGARRRPLPAVDEIVLAERPDVPLHCLRPDTARDAARRFVALFPGTVLYAVKCNPDPALLTALWAGGVRHFDCASAAEVRLVRNLLPEARIHFMHPVKSRTAIREAWAVHGVRDFVIDGAAELTKILEEIGEDHCGLGLVVRLALPRGGAVYDLSGKFGAMPDEAARLLRQARAVADRVGLCFHVGSQCLEPAAWTRALDLAGSVIAQAGVTPDIVDVGGGFPVSYPDLTPPPVEDFVAAIRDGIARLSLPAWTEIWCEPGRALVAPAASVVVRVEARRDDALFINDGIYGALSDAGAPGFRFPCRLIRAGDRPAAGTTLAPFLFFGPTCDSADRMKGPFLLPADIQEGDWIEIGQLGAYGACLRTAFNGFTAAAWVEIRDRPLLETPGYGHERAA